MSNKLSSKIAAENAAMSRANELWPILSETLNGWVGKKVLKADESLVAYLLAAVKEIPEYQQRRSESSGYGIFSYVHHYKNKYSLCFEVTAVASDDESSCYATQVINIGDVQDGTLSSLRQFKARRDDYNEQEVIALLEEARRLRKVLRDAENATHPFSSFI